MIAVLCAGVVVVLLYWLVVPSGWRRDALMLGSLAALASVDLRLPVLVVVAALGLLVVTRRLAARPGRLLTVCALGAVTGLFVWNKWHGGAGGVLATQAPLALVGTSYLVLKLSAAVIDARRGQLAPAGLRDVLGWLAFVPTYPAGPIMTLDGFRPQRPAFDRAVVLGGIERVLVGAVKALVIGYHLGRFCDAVLADPAGHGRLTVLVAIYALAWRFYLDFAGYSDIAIGFGAALGYRIDENFDAPLLRRNLVQLWQRWHMTLTRWLRLYVFIPVSRALLRALPRLDDRVPLVAAQLVTMTVCGLWHGLSWNFALWGLSQGIGLAVVGIVARDLGPTLPPRFLGWWRTSPIAAGVSTALSFHAFAVPLVLVATDAPGAWLVLRRLVAG
jgi:D-alanyl-lipoteichoic acid acyltransferase DltB (MBOAT superfamily)